MCVQPAERVAEEKWRGGGAYEADSPHSQQYLDWSRGYVWQRRTGTNTMRLLFCSPTPRARWRCLPSHWRVTTCVSTHVPELKARGRTRKMREYSCERLCIWQKMFIFRILWAGHFYAVFGDYIRTFSVQLHLDALANFSAFWYFLGSFLMWSLRKHFTQSRNATWNEYIIVITYSCFNTVTFNSPHLIHYFVSELNYVSWKKCLSD